MSLNSIPSSARKKEKKRYKENIVENEHLLSLGSRNSMDKCNLIFCTFCTFETFVIKINISKMMGCRKEINFMELQCILALLKSSARDHFALKMRKGR